MNKEEIKTQDVLEFLKERNKSKYTVLDIDGDINHIVQGDTFKQEELISVKCKVEWAEPSTLSLETGTREVSINMSVLENYIMEKNAITWYI